MGDEKKLVTSWFKNVQSLPENYVHPPETRPGDELIGYTCRNIPVIDLGNLDRAQIIQEILEASQEFGFFQVINHGVSKELTEEAMNVFKEFHNMGGKEKIEEGSKDPNGSCKMFTSCENYEMEKIHHWKDTLTHFCNPIHKYSQFWPQKPARYRDVVGKYLVEVKKLSQQILEILCERLGLSPGYFDGEMSENPSIRVNHYPPCPDPSSTLGLSKHRDPGLITILLQDVCGLQVLKDGKWIGVDPIPHAFVVNIGYVLQVISNGKLVGAEHRVVTNSRVARTSATYLVYPADECLVEPAKTLVDPCKIPHYKAFKYKDFWTICMSKTEHFDKAVMDFIVRS